MAEQDEVREDLQVELFNVVGKSVTLKSRSSPSYNTRGEEEDATWATSTITIVPYNIIDPRKNSFEAGDRPDGEMEAAVNYTDSVSLKDVITVENKDYEIVEIMPNYLPDNVVTIIRMTLTDTVVVGNLNLLDSGSNQLLTSDSDTLYVTS